MEQDLGKYLTEEEVVHHINEIKDDNRIENLQLMTIAEHRSHHTTKDKSDRVCFNCKTTYVFKNTGYQKWFGNTSYWLCDRCYKFFDYIIKKVLY